jgi:hypothetical protein
MKLRFRLPFFLCVLIFHCFTWPGGSGAGNAGSAFELKADAVLWDRLSYRAKSILGKVKTDVHLMAVPTKAGADLLMTDAAGEALQPSGATVFILTVHSNIIPLIGSDEILKTQSWFNPNDATALQRVRQRLGKEKWQKSYRFTEIGVLRQRTKPQDQRENELPPQRWTKVKEAFYAYNSEGLKCTAILEPSALLYLVSAIDFEIQELPLSLCVFNKKQLHRVNVSLSGQRRISVNYLEKAKGRQIRRDKNIEAVLLSFEPRALVAEDTQPETFSFLGLKGKFEVYIDKATHLPVQISGKISTFGQIDIKLQEAELTKQPLPQ